MITKFTAYIKESRKSIDELETLNPYELVELLIFEVQKDSPDFQFIQDLIAVGCPIDAKNKEGWGALHVAASYGTIEVIKFLVSKGANINVRDIDDWTALHFAARNGDTDIAKFLVSKEIDVNARDDAGRTALYFAVLYSKDETLKFLISKGADVNARDDNDQTAWDIASNSTRKLVPELKPTH